MEPLEIDIDQYRIATFDGRVLKVFGGQVRRFHARLLTVTVPGPDKRGNRDVTLAQSGTQHSLPVDEGAFQRLQPLLSALQTAGVRIAG